MRRIKEEADKTRQSILDAALTVFSKQGYHSARLQDIAKGAEVTRGAIYHHFGSKANLYTALIIESSEMFDSVISKAISEGGTFQEVGKRVLITGWTLLEEDPHLASIVELINFKTGFSSELSEINKKREEGSKTQVVYIAGFVQKAIERGELRPDFDPEIVARSFMALQNGIMNLWLANRNAFSLKECAPALAETFFLGMGGQ